MEINKDLIKYVESNIMLQYINNNYGGHGWSHIISVIDRSFELAKKFNLDINPNIVYVVASYHDLGYRKDPDNHEQVSSEMFIQDEMMKNFFTDEERKMIAEAIIDHRASLEYEARSVYGKLVSSADREISVENTLERSINFQSEKHKEERPTINQVIEYSFKKLSSKYGKGGYAKMYFPDEKYEEYLKTMQELFLDKDKFIQAERNIIFSQPDILRKYFINSELKKYIEDKILPRYNANDKGHGIDHIMYVIDRSLRFAKNIENINLNMVYTIASYHDIGHSIDAKNHEEVSAQILLEDKELRKYFTEEEIIIMSEAVADHRASLEYEPRSIYGKIVSSADRNTNFEVPFKRTYEYRKKHYGDVSLKQIIDESYEHLLNKFGKKGYATEKMYFEDIEYKTFLEELGKLLENRSEFDKKYIQINCLEKEIIKAQIESYVPFNEQEEVDKKTILSFIDSFDDVLTRQNSYGHLTASAFVVNEDLTKALILHHNIFGGFIYPGGHADGEYDLYSVAVREVSEETGLDVVPLIDNSIFSLQALPIKGHVKKGKYVSAHIHYDILYLLVAKNIDMDKIRILESENSQVKWCDLEDTYNDEAVDWIKPINEKIVQKVRSLRK